MPAMGPHATHLSSPLAGACSHGCVVCVVTSVGPHAYRLKVAYVHIAEADWEDAPVMERSFKESIRANFTGTLIYSGKYTKTRAEEALQEGWTDLIGFGRPFIANPDLPYRLEHNLPLNEPKREFFFGGGVTGYTDYPFYQ